MAEKKPDPIQIARDTLREALLRAGWAEDKTVAGWAYRSVTNPQAQHRETVLVKDVTGTFGVSQIKSRERLYLYPMQAIHLAWGPNDRDRFDPPITSVLHEGPGHPHRRGDMNHVCYHAVVPLSQLKMLPPEGMGITIAALVEQYYTTTNPASLANDNYRLCNKCREIEYRRVAFECPFCHHLWCRKCNPEGKCQLCPGPIETPEGMEGWQYAAQRYRWPPSAGLVRTATLIGCGVTGSWAALVLNRTCAVLNTVDPDMLAHPNLDRGEYINRAGVWRIEPQKSGAVERPQTYIWANDDQRRRRESEYIREHLPRAGRVTRGRFEDLPVGADLLVLCLDTAGSRLHATPTMARRIMDVRGTPTSCVFWGLPGNPQPPRVVQGMGMVIPANATRDQTANAYAGRICAACGEPCAAGVPIIYWAGAVPGQSIIHRDCEALFTGPLIDPGPVPPPPPMAPRDEQWWAAWKASLQGYDEAERCGDHHDAVSLAAGTTTAYFLSWWIQAGMPIGLWEVTFNLDPTLEVRDEATQRAIAV